MNTTACPPVPTLEALASLKAGTTTILIELNSSTIITCKGEDASTFLQGQLTCDVLELGSLEENHEQCTTLGSCCSPNGRMAGMFYVVKYSNTCLWLIVTKSNAPKVLQHLGKYSVFSKVTLEENPEQLPLFGVISAPQLPVPASTSESTLVSLGLQDTSLYITTTPEAFIVSSISAPEAYWELALMLEGLPKFDEALTDKFMPSDFHLDELGGVSYNKGCYTGQEPIARLHFKGKPKFSCRLIQWQSDTPITEPNTAIRLDNQKIGTLVQSLALANNQWLGLARLRIDTLASQMSNPLILNDQDCKAEIAKVAYNERRKSLLAEQS